MTISLSEFETITRALIANNELADGNSFVCDLIYSRQRFMDACDPATILRLLAVCKALRDVVAQYDIDEGDFGAMERAHQVLKEIESP